MRTVRTVAELRARARAGPPRGARRSGSCPTMGALHEGHLSLIRRAREQCDAWWSSPVRQPRPVQRARRPRALSAREARRRRAGRRRRRGHAVRAVRRGGLPARLRHDRSRCSALTERLEGAARGSEHFRGVATVVTKLLCMAQPDVAYFGQKDAQQVVVIRRLVADLNLPVRDRGAADGARARRPGDVQPQRAARPRASARARWRCPPRSRRRASWPPRASARPARARRGAAASDARRRGVEPEYVALVDPDTLEPLEELERRRRCWRSRRASATCA